MDEGLQRSAWITLGLVLAAYALLNHPLATIVLGAVSAAVWVLRSGSTESMAGRLRGLRESVLDTISDRRSGGAGTRGPTPESAGGDPEAPGQRAADELSGMLRDLCGAGGESSKEGSPAGEATEPAAFPEAGRMSAGKSPVPDYAGAVMGYREWLLMPGSPDPAALYSLTRQALASDSVSPGAAARRHQQWPLGEAHGAACGNPSNRGGVGGACRDYETCACGFYAWNAAGRLGVAGRKGYAEQISYLVPGVIAGWGRVSLHEKGFRCQYAKVVALLDPGEVYFAQGNDPEGDREAYAELVERSGLPTLSWRELREPGLARRLGLLDPRELAG